MRNFKKASITIESALIFPIAIIIIIALIKFAFYIHDITVTNMLQKYQEIKVRMIEWSYYDVEDGKINIGEAVNKPLININNEYVNNEKMALKSKINEYKSHILSGYYRNEMLKYGIVKDSKELLNGFTYESGIKNSTIVRLIKKGEDIFD